MLWNNPIVQLRENPKDPKTMTAGEINRELDRLEKQRSKLNDEFIAAGRGNETVNETAKKTDPLATRYNEIADRIGDLQVEIYARYGPGAPHRLPTRGFGPRIRDNLQNPRKSMQQNPRRRLSKKCQGIVSRTAASEQRKGVPQKQAVAIGYSKARRAGCRVPPPPGRRLEENPVSFWGKFLG